MDCKAKKKPLSQDNGQATQSPWTEFNRQHLSKTSREEESSKVLILDQSQGRMEKFSKIL